MATVTPIVLPLSQASNYTTKQRDMLAINDDFSLSTPSFFTTNSYIEFHILNNSYEVLQSNLDYRGFVIKNDGQSALTGEIDKIEINPITDLGNPTNEDGTELLYETERAYEFNYTTGEYITCYKFYNKEIGNPSERLFIKQISSDRTELKLGNLGFGFVDFSNQVRSFINKRAESNEFVDFYLNFGDYKIVLGINIAFDDNNPDEPDVLIKLHSPLPSDYEIDDQLWIVTEFDPPKAYKVSFDDQILTPSTPSFPKLKGPNFNLDFKNRVNNSTENLSYSDLIKTKVSSSSNQIQSLLKEKELKINIDYNNYSNFIHFSSAQTRLENFYYKVGLIEQYSASISSLDNTISSSSTLSGSKGLFQSKISNIINNFDGYDKFLYYESGSRSYPNLTSQKPYLLAKSDSNEVLTWLGSTDFNSSLYGGQVLSASLFDEQNQDGLFYAIPEYLRNDPANDPYKLFVDMVAQHYDNIWIYYRDVSEKYNADNRLNFGISKDIVADAIKEFGLKIYQNNFSNNDLYTAFLGLTPNGSLFPFPNITGSLPTPSGFEYVNTLISASNDSIPLDDVNKSLYKRIYHNIPRLLKTKGTIPGLRALITSYGIPDTILRINEFGGKDKINVNDWDHWQNEFNYAFSTTGSNYISSSWHVNDNWYDSSTGNVPEAVEFRFKTNGLPTSNIPRSQSLWHLSGSGFGESAVTLRYEGTAYTSASYNGSIKDPYYQYAYLDFYPLTSLPNQTASVYLPFFNGDWWSVAVQRDDSTNSKFTLKSANKIYKGGNNNTSIGFISSSTVNFTSSLDGWRRIGNISYFPSFTNILTNYTPFSGSYQEIRYFKPQISESIFKDYTMNPYSIEGNSINSSPNDLVFRASLGGELYTSSNSIHPKVTGSWVPTQSFNNGFSNFNFNSTPTFLPNHEYFFTDQPIAGIKNIVGDKIRIENNVIPSGDTLSPYMSLSQQVNISQSYTPNINYLEVAFSPQNEVNEDIMNQIGFFNIGDYIGDPRQRSSSATSYPDLDNLRDDYFQKYTKNYNLKDFIRLIKFFDNSLFKMIKDFVPARTSLASGIVIKQHLLERNKYPQPQLSFQHLQYSGTLKPQWDNYKTGSRIVNAVGGTGGSFERYNGLITSPSGALGVGPSNNFNLTQSWSESFQTTSGSITTTRDQQYEFYNGEFSGSGIVVSTQDLNAHCDKYKKVNPTGAPYFGVRIYSGSTYLFNEWIKDNNKPTDGYISMWYQDNNNASIPPLPLQPYDDFVPGVGIGGTPPNDNQNEFPVDR